MSAFHAEGINIGAAGIVLGLATVDRALGRSDFTAAIRTGAEWLAARRPEGQSAGLFTGNAGVAVALAVAGRQLGNPAFSRASESRLRHAAVDGREIDLFSGAAGALYACSLLTDITGDDWALEYGSSIVRWLERHARVEKDVPVWSIDPQSDVHYLGCAHGSAGVAMALACWGSRTGDQVCLDRALDTFRRIHASGRTSDGRAVRMTLDADRAHAVGTWCHGVAGYLWCMVNACGDHPLLRREIDWAVDAVCDSMTVGTPTYCHGLAGRLELWRMLGGLPRFRDLAASQAGKTVRALRLTHQKAEGRAAWCSDDPAIVTPDLWIGFLGPATALALHVRAERAALLSGQWLARCARA
jgi:lantibiotic modifying enzyme